MWIETATLTTHATPGTVTTLTAADTYTNRWFVYADGSNTVPLSIGFGSDAALFTVDRSNILEGVEPPFSKKLNLKDVKIKAAAAAQGYRILYWQ